MSALGHKRTYAVQKGMSALPPIATAKADIRTPDLGSWPGGPKASADIPRPYAPTAAAVS